MTNTEACWAEAPIRELGVEDCLAVSGGNDPNCINVYGQMGLEPCVSQAQADAAAAQWAAAGAYVVNTVSGWYDYWFGS